MNHELGIGNSHRDGTHTAKRTFLSQGFTLVELIVSISIFAMMTALVVAKYGTFNQSVLLTNLAYDMALTIRTAQTYGVSVRQEGGGFKYPYGVNFNLSVPTQSQFIFFADVDSSGSYNGEDILLNTYTLKRGATIKDVCIGTGPSDCPLHPQSIPLNITYTRPDPDARICHVSCETTLPQYARITIKGTDGSTRAVVVRKNGQISVED